MLNGIYSSATALNTAGTQHEIISNNLANLNVAGFRRTLLSVSERGPAANDLGQPTSQPLLRGSQAARAVIDFSPGSLKATGRSLDLAVNGEGFFAIQGPQQTLYTRNGFFHVNEDRTIVNGDGLPLLSNGSTIEVPPEVDASDLKISENGVISAGGSQIGEIELLDFDDKALLKPIGAANFAASINQQEIPASGRVIQGSLEMANTHAVSEMVNLITGSRHFESAQRALRIIADAIEKFTNIDQ